MNKLFHSFWIRWQRLRINLGIWQLSRQVLKYNSSRQQKSPLENKPVVFFNASTRIVGVSQNAAFALLAALGLQVAGVPVVYFGCNAGMRKCVLGTRLEDLNAAPPCRSCVNQSRWLFSHAPVIELTYQEDQDLRQAIQNLDLRNLCDFEYQGLPLGKLVMPSMRWVLRRHHLPEDAATLQLMRDYILSAYRVGREFERLVSQVEPACVVVFNGMFFPEATARWVAQQRKIPVVTHEVGLRPFSAFFTFGEATAYPLHIPEDFQLTERQNQALDRYLERRFQGQFSMAGVRFWKTMSGLDADIVQKIEAFRQVVAVFTNVIFDTSQPHSNVIFPHMFAWLDLVIELAREHRDTLFILRAHPDENRHWKESRESVADWVVSHQVDQEPNVLFIEPSQPTSSYALIQSSKFVMVYNSTIGLEASILGKPVLSAGRARYTQLPTVFFPPSIQEFRETVEEFLTSSTIEVPSEFQKNARRFLYYQLFNSSLPFSNCLEEDGIWPGFVRLRRLDWKDLHPEHSLVHRVIYEGIVDGKEFTIPVGGEFLLD